MPAPGNQVHPKIELPAVRRALPRIAGYDLSRAIAIFGMLVINFDAFVESVVDKPGWPSMLLDSIEGRAAATFVLLAGVGISLGARRFGSDPLFPGHVSLFRRQLTRRAILIFIIGMLFSLTWEADILHYYGVFLFIGALFIGASGRILLHAAFFGINLFVLLFLLFKFEAGWDWETLSYVDFWSLPGMLRHLFFNGCYPVFPWIGFLLIGMWLGRRNLTDRKRQIKLLGSGLGLLMLVALVSKFAGVTILELALASDNIKLIQFLEVDPWTPLPLFILAGLGSAFVIIGASFLLIERYGETRWAQSLVTIGRMSFSIYIFHILFGRPLIEAIALPEKLAVYVPTVVAVLFFFASIKMAGIWQRYFSRGPLELALRYCLQLPWPSLKIRRMAG